MKERSFSDEVLDHPNKFITDYYTQAAMLNTWPHAISDTLHKKGELVYRKKVEGGKRTVYVSMGSRRTAQYALRPLVKELQSGPEMEHIWYCKEGVNVRQAVREYFTGWKLIIHFDIVKYFENIDFKHVKTALRDSFNFTNSGAKLLARQMTIHNGKRMVLQTGSPISGEVSNIVGYHFFDRKILRLIEKLRQENPRMLHRFMRYGDNVILAVDGEFGIDMPERYKAGCREIMSKARFRTHKWSTTYSDSPRRAQKILGIVVNKQARIDNEKFQKVRATLFNCCTNGSESEANRFFSEFPTSVWDMYNIFQQMKMKKEKLNSVMRGKIAYINDVSRKQGLQLQKLLAASELFDRSPAYAVYKFAKLNEFVENPSLWPGLFTALKRYTDNNETLDAYLDRLRRIVENS